MIRLRVPSGREVTFHDIVRGPVTFHTDVIGDPVLVRSDGMPAYNFAVVVDDALMRVTHVVRGEDHISNTPRQVLLYEAFGWQPPSFAHLSLVMGPDHTPLSKRHGATSVAEFRAKGYLPEALVNYLALIGWSPGDGEEVLPLDELAKRFELSTVAHSAGVFDEDKLAWVNRHYLKAADPARLVELSLPFLREASLVAGDPTPRHVNGCSASYRRWPRRSIGSRSFPSACRRSSPTTRAQRWRVRTYGASSKTMAHARSWRRLPRTWRQRPGSPIATSFRAAAGRVKDKTGKKGRALFHPIRVALTGAAEGPELDLLVPAIDRATELPSGSGLPATIGCRERARRVSGGPRPRIGIRSREWSDLIPHAHLRPQ